MKINKLLIILFLAFGSLNAESINYKDFIKDEIPLIKSSNPNAIDIIEFSSFTCSHCRDFHTITLPEIKQSEIIEDINYYIIDFPLDYFAFYASKISSCIGDNRSTFTNIVYDQQDTWKKIYKSSEPESQFELENTLVNYALQLGHSESELLQCIENEEIQNKLLAKQMDAQKKYKVESTPTFLINGEKVMGNQPAIKFVNIIKEKLKE